MNDLAAQLQAEQELRLIWCRQATENEHRRWKATLARNRWKALAKKKARQHWEMHRLWVDALMHLVDAGNRILQLEAEVAALKKHEEE